MTQFDQKMMQRCFELALLAKGQTSPNPLVGSVIVKDGKIISEGHHQKSGLPHAELDAIQKANESIEGATLYCNLEPCCHTNKKTPPCAQRIVKEKISKVVICNLDPNPDVAGNGVKILEEAGIEVIHGILEDKGKLLNEVFFHHIINKTPFIHLKWAQTLDGKTATMKDHSKWITNDLSRARVHQERNLYDAIMVGANTLNLDNPKLTTRIGQDITCTTRLVLSPSGKINLNSNLFSDKYQDKTYIITNNKDLIESDLNTIQCPMNGDQIDVKKLLINLYNMGICSIYIEGGLKTTSHFIKENYFNRLSVYIAPKIIGKGKNLEGFSFDQINDGLHFTQGRWTQLGSDILFENKENICLQV